VGAAAYWAASPPVGCVTVAVPGQDVKTAKSFPDE